MNSTRTLKVRSRLLSLETPKIMAILNATSDSFYAGSRVKGYHNILRRVEQFIAEGADIIDLGVMSSRPGAEELPLKDEIKQLTELIGAIRKTFPHVIISADTYRLASVRAAIDVGADIINDISGGTHDPEVYSMCAQQHIAYICMHMRGNAGNMQSKTEYNDVLQEVLEFFADRCRVMQSHGLYDYAIDPGFGFAKTLKQNYHLLKNLPSFSILEAPILVGLSRKSMIYNLLTTTPEKALNGTSALHMNALMRGADILRVHDVSAAVEVKRLYQQLI